MPPNSPCSFSIIHYATSSVKKCHNRESMAVRVSKLRFVPTLTLMDDLGKVTYSLWISISFTPSSLSFSNRKMTPWGTENKSVCHGMPSYFFTLPQPSPRWEATLNHGHVCSEFLSPNIRSWKLSTERVNPRTQEHWKRAAARASWE